MGTSHQCLNSSVEKAMGSRVDLALHAPHQPTLSPSRDGFEFFGELRSHFIGGFFARSSFFLLGIDPKHSTNDAGCPPGFLTS